MEDENKGSESESDHEVLEREHSKLLSAVRQLDGKQRVKPPSRKETSREISEFNLGKHQIKNDTVGIHELTKALEKRASHVEIGEKLKTFKQKAKPLERPLEKVEAEKIKRAVGFTNAKKQLSRWHAFVDRNRVAENLIYPLIPKGSITLDKTEDFIKRFESQSELEAKISEILRRSNAVKQQKEAKEEEEKKEEEFPLNLEEIIERRKEMAKLRAQQSYREAKAHRQKKIKSKSFHRSLRRQRIKQQLKDFETLQKTDPEAALKQLEQIERARAEERMTLRHRNTGKWARSLAIRAKYNDQTRRELAEQLSISRDLTRKIAVEESSDDEGFEEELNMNNTSNSDNPWVNGKTESEVENFVRGYQRFWEKKNGPQTAKDTDSQENWSVSNAEIPMSDDGVIIDGKAEISGENGNLDVGSTEVCRKRKSDCAPALEEEKNENGAQCISLLDEDSKKCTDEKNKTKFTTSVEKNKKLKKSLAKEKKRRKVEISDEKLLECLPTITGTSGCWEVTVDSTDNDLQTDSAVHNKTLTKKKKRKNTSTICVTVNSAVESVDDLFTRMEERMKDSVNQKIAKYRQEVLNNEDGVGFTGDRDDDENLVSLEMRKQIKRPDLDEALTEETTQHNTEASKIEIEKLQKLSHGVIEENKKIHQKNDLDPKKIIAVKAKPLDSELPDVAEMEEALDDDADDESARQLTITEAFADDDVVDQFRKEKEETVKKSEPEDIDLSLPGWGTWGGKGILAGVPKKKKKRFIIKFPKPPPRKDANKGDVIINEEKDVKIKEHQVSELPFPFTTVRDFEASVRAPIGTTWITQSAHKKLTLPKYKTMLGKVIKPIDEEILLKKKPVRRSSDITRKQ